MILYCHYYDVNTEMESFGGYYTKKNDLKRHRPHAKIGADQKIEKSKKRAQDAAQPHHAIHHLHTFSFHVSMSTWSRTLTQQRALAYAPKPLGFLSFLSSSYVIYHLIREQPHKCKRMYHRLVLAMSIANLPSSAAWIWGNWVRICGHSSI